jgi:hypothetical protein
MPPAWPETIDYGHTRKPLENARKQASDKSKSRRVLGHGSDLSKCLPAIHYTWNALPSLHHALLWRSSDTL